MAVKGLATRHWFQRLEPVNTSLAHRDIAY